MSVEVKIDLKEIRMVPLSEIKLNPKNRNKHPQEQIDRFVKILRANGFRSLPVISNRTGQLVAGEGRYLAMKQEGMTEMLCSFQDFENEEEEYAHAIADNALQEWSSLDRAGINQDILDLGPFDIHNLGLKDFVVDVSEFNEPEPEVDSEEKEEIDQEKEIEENEEIPEKVEPQTKLHDHFRIGQHQLYNGDCLERMKLLENESIHALVSDPPAGIAFMGKDWDEDKGGGKEWTAWMTRVMEQAFRVLKPGAHGLVWAIPRTSHWTASALEDAGFEIRDVVTHVFGSGFPKSHDISKGIDKAAGAEREVLETLPAGTGPLKRGHVSATGGGMSIGTERSPELKITAPSTPDAKKWAGFGTALKPASEHWILVRKPCSEDTVAKNVLKHGVGGINIDISRINGAPRTTHKEGNIQGTAPQPMSWGHETKHVIQGASGRFPANFLLSHSPDCVEMGTKKVGSGEGSDYNFDDSNNDNPTRLTNNIKSGVHYGTETVAAFECTPGCAVAELDRQSGFSKTPNQVTSGGKTFHGDQFDSRAKSKPSFGDSGGASRFFYVAKPSKREKNEGCEELPEKEKKTLNDYSKPSEGRTASKSGAPMSNHHPTVKSIRLMSYLINMVTPPGGTLIDPFGGSGTTLVAAELNGFKSILFEQSEEYCDIILARAEKITKTKVEHLNG